MINDEHFKARGLFESVEINGEALKIPAILPKSSNTPGAAGWAVPALGSHTYDVLGSILGLSGEKLT